MKCKFLVWFCFIILSSSTFGVIPGFCIPSLCDLEKSINLANAQLPRVLTRPGEESGVGVWKGLPQCLTHKSISVEFIPPPPPPCFSIFHFSHLRSLTSSTLPSLLCTCRGTPLGKGWWQSMTLARTWPGSLPSSKGGWVPLPRLPPLLLRWHS